MCALCRVLRVAVGLAVVLVTCLLSDSARAVIRDGGIDPANLGKGTWIYQLHHAVAQCNENVPSVTNVQSLMIYLKNQGMRYIIVKAGTGAELFGVPGYNPQFTSSLVNQAHAAGLWIFGYNRSYATNTAGEVAIANHVFQQGADGFVWDAEAEWESSRIGSQGPALAEAQCSQVRSNWPNKFLAHSPFPIISYHSSFPYKEFGYYCDAVMPQDYWIQIGVTPTYMVQWMTTEYRNWQNGLSGKWVNSIKPIVPAGQGWSSAEGTVTAAQITEFVTAVKNQANPATAGGYKGVNYWVCELHPPDVWGGIRTNNITVFTGAPVIANVSDGAVTSTSATITWTTDQSSDSVVEYGTDTSYGSAVTNSTPIYYHTVTLSGLSPSMTYHFRAKSKNSNNQTGVSGDYVFTTEAMTVPDVIVESYLPGPTLNNNPPYVDSQFVGSPSSCKSSAPGLNGVAAVRYATGGGGSSPSVTLRPTLAVAGGTYKVYVTHCATSCSADLVASVSQGSCSGLPATTPVFQSSYANTWALVGQVTLNAGVTVPTIIFTRSGGTLGSSSRMYSDGYKFVYVPPPPQPPAIATQPQSQTNNLGNNATFSVVASGTPVLFYQWRFNGANITGATQSSYTRLNIQPSDAGSYSVVITNGIGSTNSANALLTVIVPPTIVVQPTDTGAGAGMSASFSVTATGSGTLQYQWRFNGANVSGATASSYTVTDVQPSKAGPYDVVVSSAYGTNVSDTAFLTYMDPCIATQPQDQTVAAGGTAVFSATAVGTLPLGWQWRKNGADLADGGNISGAQTASLTVSGVQAGDLGNYSVLVSNVTGTAVSSNAALIGPFPPSIAAQPGDQVAGAGADVAFTVAAVGAGTLSFQWKRDGTNLADGTKFSGALTPSLVVSNAQAGDMRSYSVTVANSFGSVGSSNALLKLWPLAAWGAGAAYTGSFPDYGQSAVPQGLLSVAGVAAGFYHSLALNTDGTVAAWGAGTLNSGANYQHGQAMVPPGATNIVATAAGAYHSLALKADGTVVAWGAGSNYTVSLPHYGQCAVPPGLNNAVAVAGGGYHSLALRADGTVVAWGAGTNNTGVSPHYGQSVVPGGLSNVVAVAAGFFHSLALKSDGTVVAWGAGVNNTGFTPDCGQAQVPAGLSHVVAIAGGGYHSLALRADGTVAAWGAGTNNTGSNPNFGQAQVPAGAGNVVALAAGLYHSLLLRADGSVLVWGYNDYGQTNTPSPVSKGAALAGGGFHSIVLEGDGAPFWTVHPFGQTIAAGTMVKLAALASGAQPVSYQWQRNGTNVPGANDAVLTLTDVGIADGGTYALIASNALGAATSAPALLTVIAPPTITTQPQSLSINEGSDATFTVAADGTPPLGYQWKFNGANIGGATGTSYTRLNAQPADAGTYTVVVTNGVGNVTSSNAVLTVNVPPAITSHPEGLTVSAGSNVTFTVTATGTQPLAYQWRFDAAAIAGATGSAYTLGNAQTTDAGSYSVVVSNVAGTETSSNAVLTVQPPASSPRIDSITRRPDGAIELQISGGPGNFAIDCAPLPSGLTQMDSVTVTGAVFQYLDAETNQASRFYRVRLLP